MVASDTTKIYDDLAGRKAGGIKLQHKEYNECRRDYSGLSKNEGSLPLMKLFGRY